MLDEQIYRLGSEKEKVVMRFLLELVAVITVLWYVLYSIL